VLDLDFKWLQLDFTPDLLQNKFTYFDYLLLDNIFYLLAMIIQDQLGFQECV